MQQLGDCNAVNSGMNLLLSDTWKVHDSVWLRMCTPN